MQSGRAANGRESNPGPGIGSFLFPTPAVQDPALPCRRRQEELTTAGSSSQEGDIYLELSWINDEKLCLHDKMMKGKWGPASRAPRVQR